MLDTAYHGTAWVIGHTLTLFAFGGAVLLADALVPEDVASALELGVGFMLILLALQTATSSWQGLLYIAIFGFGFDSVVGMAIVGAVISLPLRYSSRGLTRAHNSLKSQIGLFTIGLGSSIVHGAGVGGGNFF